MDWPVCSEPYRAADTGPLNHSVALKLDVKGYARIQ